MLRNRAAAQKSREVKKQQLEKIEEERDLLKAQNQMLLARTRELEERLSRFLPKDGQPMSSSSPASPLPSLHPLQSDLSSFFDNADFSTATTTATTTSTPSPPTATSPTATTLNPASLLSSDSPFQLLADDESNLSSSSPSSSSCKTQQPAALLCDLPCLQEALTMRFMATLTVLATALMTTSVEAWTTFRGRVTASRLRRRRHRRPPLPPPPPRRTPPIYRKVIVV